MLPEELAALPVGTIVRKDGDEGEVVLSGSVTNILWVLENKWTPTILVDTKSKVWEKYISEIEVVE